MVAMGLFRLDHLVRSIRTPHEGSAVWMFGSVPAVTFGRGLPWVMDVCMHFSILNDCSAPMGKQ